ncbi:MAG: LytTR family DNA-binding domain-containing protein [Lachnospiraceae bacterium]|nr:LytTR family DNA-binding domain-containing protein [Lachnospiraceae bacterium]
MRIAVCDDEKEIREMIAEKIRRLYPDAELSLYQSGQELLVSEAAPDILFLDIRMSGIDGMETARELRRQNQATIIIFVTALDNFVFEAFDVRAFHYLVKPFEDRKLVEVLLNAVKEFENTKKPEEAKAGISQEKPSLMITSKGEHITVAWEDIVYAEVFNRKVIIHTMDSDIEYYGKMKELTEKAGEDFYRPHRANLINFNYIKKYDAATIYLKRGQALIAKQNYQDFVKCYLRFNQRKGKE